MRRRLRAAGMSLGLLLAPPEGLAPAASAQVPGSVIAASTTRARLAEDAVWRTDYARRELWSWTTTEQVVALRSDPRLLTRTESPTRGPSAFDVRVHEDASSSISRLLHAPGLARRRFAWSAPWATVLGMPGETYGEQLVRIVLRPEAIVGRFLAGAAAPWSFSDLRGRTVSGRVVLRDPSLLAAVYHESARKRGAGSSPPWREHVVVNEAMVERWEVATPAVIARLERDVALVRELRSELGGAAAPRGDGSPAQARRPARPTLEQLYAAALALPSAIHEARRGVALDLTLEALERALRLAQSGPPLLATPSRDFILGPVPSFPAAPPIRRAPRGTYLPRFGAR